jgi:hypothetical protein
MYDMCNCVRQFLYFGVPIFLRESLKKLLLLVAPRHDMGLHGIVLAIDFIFLGSWIEVLKS